MADNTKIEWANRSIVGIPANQRLSERKLIQLVTDGEWEIDAEGRIWRVCVRQGNRSTKTSSLKPCVRRRVEKGLPAGYLMVRAMRNKVRVVGLAHRLVWQFFHGEIPDGKTVNHKNGIKDDNRPSNLELSTFSEQAFHAHRSGLLDQHGQKNPAAKLTDNQIAQVRLAYDQGGHTMQALADRFGVSVQNISKIIRGQRRTKQGGPTASVDLRNDRGSERDLSTGRYVSKKAAGRLLDGVEHNGVPA